jgi:hypothetical protein
MVIQLRYSLHKDQEDHQEILLISHKNYHGIKGLIIAKENFLERLRIILPGITKEFTEHRKWLTTLKMCSI